MHTVNLITRLINKGLVTCNRDPWFRPQKNVVTNQIRDKRNTSLVIIKFVLIDSTAPKMEVLE